MNKLQDIINLAKKCKNEDSFNIKMFSGIKNGYIPIGLFLKYMNHLQGVDFDFQQMILALDEDNN